MLPLLPGLDVFPVAHRSASFALALRRQLLQKQYRGIVLTLPKSLAPHLQNLVMELPTIHALVLETDTQRCIIPADPCEPIIEAVRQTLSAKLPLHCAGPTTLPKQMHLPHLPDFTIDSQMYALAVLPLLQQYGDDYYHQSLDGYYRQSLDGHYRIVLQNLRNLVASATHHLLLVCHLSEWALLERLVLANASAPYGQPEVFTVSMWPIRQAHLYFALGEAPYYAAALEKNRADVFATLPAMADLVRDLVLQARDQLVAENKMRAPGLGRMQALFRYLTRLQKTEESRQGDLFTLIEAVKGTLGDTLAARVLELAKQYEQQADPWLPQLSLGVNVSRTPLDNEPRPSYILFADRPLVWRTLRLRKEPGRPEQTKWKRAWDGRRACSHLPEDIRVERFNGAAKKEALRRHSGRNAKTEPFSGNLLDGLDLRETIRHWHEQRLYVKEIPPVRGRIDTVVVIFDDSHDELYPHCVTWYAEHKYESTLSFYSTNPLDDMIGPGIGRARYGGLAMLFPPRAIPDLFNDGLTMPKGLSLAEHLTYASMLFSQERLVAYVADQRPSSRLRELSRHMGRHLVHTPLASLGRESLERLRTFHMLNGREIRTIAKRFIGY